MEFWKMCYDLKVIDSNFLRQAVITDNNKYGDITCEQYKEITGFEY
ncbi:XkdX family protein [Clostridium sp.]|nr:XkdX family protein [Clostridium sp.]MDU4478624.1 XkdX family protein [Clostridium sp.]